MRRATPPSRGHRSRRYPATTGRGGLEHGGRQPPPPGLSRRSQRRLHPAADRIRRLGEQEASERGIDCRIKSEFVPGWFTALQAAEAVYGYKTIVEKATGKVVGAHLVGPHADETINLFALAVRHGLTAGDLKNTIFAYPTAASDIGSML